MPASPHNFHVGDQAEISYCYRTHTSTHTGTVVNSGPSWIVVQAHQSTSEAVRYFLKDRRWRSEFGYRVAVNKANAEHREVPCVV